MTGATGFIGRHLIAPLLRAECDVHVVNRTRSDLRGICEHRVDLFDDIAVTQLISIVKPTDLIHLAWLTEPPEYWTSPLNEAWLDHSCHLFDAFARNGGQRIVGGGTCAEYEWKTDTMREGTTPELPATPYGKAKHRLYQHALNIGSEMGTSIAWGRFFFLFGPHERKERFVPTIIDSLLDDSEALCRNGDLVRDFLYVEDAADALSELMLSEVQGAVNIASGISLRLDAMARAIGVCMNQLQLVRNTNEAVSQPRSLVADITRLRSEVGWVPRVSMNDAIERTINWRAEQRGTNAG